MGNVVLPLCSGRTWEEVERAQDKEKEKESEREAKEARKKKKREKKERTQSEFASLPTG